MTAQCEPRDIRLRLIAFAPFAAILFGELGHIVYTWSEFFSRSTPDTEFFYKFTSFETFFLPCTIGCVLGLVAGGFAVNCRSRFWLFWVIATLLLVGAYVYGVNHAMYNVYNPHHSGPFL